MAAELAKVLVASLDGRDSLTTTAMIIQAQRVDWWSYNWRFPCVCQSLRRAVVAARQAIEAFAPHDFARVPISKIDDAWHFEDQCRGAHGDTTSSNSARYISFWQTLQRQGR